MEITIEVAWYHTTFLYYQPVSRAATRSTCYDTAAEITFTVNTFQGVSKTIWNYQQAKTLLMITLSRYRYNVYLVFLKAAQL